MTKRTNRKKQHLLYKLDTYFYVEFTHVLILRSVTFSGNSVFVSIFADNKFEDLHELKFSKIKLQLICTIEHILFLILESPRAEMCRKQTLEKKTICTFLTLILKLYVLKDLLKNIVLSNHCIDCSLCLPSMGNNHILSHHI